MTAMIADLTDFVSSGMFVVLWVGAAVVILAILSKIMK